VWRQFYLSQSVKACALDGAQRLTTTINFKLERRRFIAPKAKATCSPEGERSE